MTHTCLQPYACGIYNTRDDFGLFKKVKMVVNYCFFTTWDEQIYI